MKRCLKYTDYKNDFDKLKKNVSSIFLFLVQESIGHELKGPFIKATWGLF